MAIYSVFFSALAHSAVDACGSLEKTPLGGVEERGWSIAGGGCGEKSEKMAELRKIAKREDVPRAIYSYLQVIK